MVSNIYIYNYNLHVIVAHKTDEQNKASTTNASTPTDTVAGSSESAPINKKTHHARLGLARALAKNADGDLSESKKYYNEVIDIAPQVRY